MPEPPRLFFFAHVMKTAGSSLHLEIRQTFDYERLWPRSERELGVDADVNLRLYSSLESLRSSDLADHPDVCLVRGHFPLVARDLLPVRPTTLTILRHPVERTISHIQHCQAGRPGSTVEEIYADEELRRRFFVNHQTKMLGMSLDEALDAPVAPLFFDLPVGQAHLDRARHALDDTEIIGITERFADLLAELERDYGWASIPEPVTNVGRKARFSPELLEAIRADNELDQQLYEHALRIVDARRSSTL